MAAVRRVSIQVGWCFFFLGGGGYDGLLYADWMMEVGVVGFWFWLLVSLCG